MRNILDVLILILILPAIGLMMLLSKRAKQMIYDKAVDVLEVSEVSLTDEEWEEILTSSLYNPNHLFDTPEQIS